MPQPKQISQTSATTNENRQTQVVLPVKRSESDELRSKSLIKFLSRMPEVLDIRAEFYNYDTTQEWDVLGGSVGPESSAKAEGDPEQLPDTSGGREITDEQSATTKDNPVVGSDNQDQEDNVQPGPSKISNPKRQGKVNRATTSSKKRDVQTRGTGVQMQMISSSERLADEMDSSSVSSMEIQRRSRQLLVGWDTFRSRTMLLLIGLLVLWAIIYFPLILA